MSDGRHRFHRVARPCQPERGRVGAPGRPAGRGYDRSRRPGHVAVRRRRRRTSVTGAQQRRDYTQFLRAPLRYRRHLRDCDLVVEVCNGMPYLSPLWYSRPLICLVNHMHTELWRLRFPPPLAGTAAGPSTLMPWAHRNNLFLTVSTLPPRRSADIGVGSDRLRSDLQRRGASRRRRPARPSRMFLALGRLADYKRIDLLLRLWGRVRPVVGGTLVIAGDGPERSQASRPWPARMSIIHRPGVGGGEAPAALRRLAAAAPGPDRGLGPGGRRGRHPRHPGHRLRRTRAARFHRSTPDRRAGRVRRRVRLRLGLAGARPPARHAMGRAARERAELHWSAAVEGFAQVADEALAGPAPPSRRPPHRSLRHRPPARRAPAPSARPPDVGCHTVGCRTVGCRTQSAGPPEQA